MKTYNKHPQWYNQPLRLTEEQLDNPLLVLDDFFQCFHLNETREVLWQWLTAIISSPGSISSEPLERSNHIYFYEKIEEVIEAAFMLKTNKQLMVYQDSATNEEFDESDEATVSQMIDTSDNLTKRKRLIEYVEEDPMYVIKEVFKPENEFTSAQIKAWLLIGLLTECSAYDDSEQREQLKIFHDDLLILIDAVYVIYSKNVKNKESIPKHLNTYEVTVLRQEQIANPQKEIIDFLKKYPSIYIDRELEDWLEAGLCYTGNWPDDLFCRGQLLDTHRRVLCLIKAAVQLISKD